MMLNPKILLFTDWYAPGFKGGGPIRSAVNFAREMSSDYDIYIFTADRDLGDTKPYDDIEADTWIRKENMHIFYASPQWLGWRNIKNLIRTTGPDFIYLNSMYSRYFTIYPLLLYSLGKVSSQIILAPRGMLQEGAMQYKTGKKKLFLGVLRNIRILKNVHAHATDEQEKKDISIQLSGISSVKVIPNFSAPVQTYQATMKNMGEINLIFISRISSKKNLIFLLTVLGRVTGSITAKLTIRGTIEDDSYWEECKTLINKLPGNVRVNYDGPVSNERVCSLIQQYHLFVLPTFGENFGHAIFEALAAGRPVLISDQTPWRHLEQQHAGWDLPLDDSRRFINVIENIAEMDNTAFEQWSRGAWEYAKAHSENTKLREQYKDLFS
ncbi:MAG: glycosyltransferase family 4 protein [Sphingobacteriales bacterium]|nr:glycosyltransferase family 4 protein [Sphingobacteriales bacterium]